MSTKTGLDLMTEEAMLWMADPRPVNIGPFVRNFIRYMEHGGYLIEGFNDADREHLTNKMESMVRGYVVKDRKEFHGIDLSE